MQWFNHMPAKVGEYVWVRLWSMCGCLADIGICEVFQLNNQAHGWGEPENNGHDPKFYKYKVGEEEFIITFDKHTSVQRVPDGNDIIHDNLRDPVFINDNGKPIMNVTYFSELGFSCGNDDKYEAVSVELEHFDYYKWEQDEYIKLQQENKDE